MNLKELGILLDYHYWALDRLFDAIASLSPDQFTREIDSSFRSIRDTLVHTYSAEWIWYSRWQGESPTGMLQPGTFPDVAELRKTWKDQETRMRAFLGSLDEDGVQRVIHYKLLSGQATSSPLWQMLQHVVNHASYHRGQITTMLRQLGASPPKNMDLITFYRENSAQ